VQTEYKGGYFMKKVISKIIVFLGVLLFSVGAGGVAVQAAIAHPHPTYKDTWNYGTSGNHGWSYYYLEASVRLGSSATVKNIFGTVKVSKTKDYGWAKADATKSWNDLRLDAFYGWYWF
jgi:hypothetical protein